MKKQKVQLHFFSGFYESLHAGVFDSEEEQIMEDYPGKKYEDFRFTTNYIEYCKKYVSAISSEIGIDLEFQEMWSPREYNFMTDKITCWIKPKDVKKIAEALDSDAMKKIIKQRFTSRDGFISFYSNNLEDWKEKKLKDWDEIELGTLLDAWMVDNESEDYWKDLDYVGFEYCQGNGQYVDFTKMWDEEAEKEEEELHQNELNKLEAWKKSCASWQE
jgi:hypothetical protein